MKRMTHMIGGPTVKDPCMLAKVSRKTENICNIGRGTIDN